MKKITKPVRGRPKGPPSKTVYVDIRADLRDKLAAECKEQGRTLKATLERILDWFFSQKKA